MKRVLIVGNSHSGALKTGWDQCKERHPNVDIDFFAVPNRCFVSMDVLDGSEFGVPDAGKLSEEEKQAILRFTGSLTTSIEGYDAILICGHSIRLIEAAALAEAFEIDGLAVSETPRPNSLRMSAPAYRAIVKSLAALYLPPQGWYNLTAKRVYLLPMPRPSEVCRNSSSTAQLHKPFIALARGRKNVSGAFSVYENSFAECLEAQGMTLVRQPPETLTAEGFSKEHFSHGSKRLVGGLPHQHDDFVHMNTTYGVKVLDQFLAAIG